MPEVITPKHILEDLLRDLSHKPYLSAPQRWALKIAAGALLVGSITFILIIILNFVEIDAPWVGGGMLILSLLSLLSWIIAIVSTFLLQVITNPTILYKQLRHPERTELEHVISTFNDELALMYLLVRTYDQHHLEYAQERVALEVAHIRSSSAALFRSLEQVGVVPVAVAAYLAYLAYPPLRDSRIISGMPDAWIIGPVLVLFYVLAMHKHRVCQQLDRFALVLKHAVQVKKLDPSSRNMNVLS